MQCEGDILTPKVLSQAKQESHRLVVLLTGTARGRHHQGFGARGPGGPQDAVHVGAFHHLGGVQATEEDDWLLRI